ncbi:MAG: hypothetical protein JWQ76_2680 [Ramlibacter sp.]|nr:hypothetical protein [Ramlibacter sp.]
MKRRTDMPELPNFPLVARAYDMARGVTCRSAEALRVGIVDPSGAVTANGVLRGYSQATVFAELMRKIGYQELLPRTAQRICECHVAFVAPRTAGEANPQSILPQTVLDLDLWPGIGFETATRREPELVD